MEIFFISSIIGAVISALGLKNMFGRVSALHWYHCRRVAPYDVRAFGKMVGGGMLAAGISCITFGSSFLLLDTYDKVWWILIGTLVLIIGITLGAVLSVVALVKYNKGIF